MKLSVVKFIRIIYIVRNFLILMYLLSVKSLISCLVLLTIGFF